MEKTEKLLSEMTLEELWRLFPIILREHDPEWKNWYAGEKELLAAHFREALVRIHHIGSTAVPGLLAKPTVDILLEAAPEVPAAALRQMAAGCGYLVMAEAEKPFFYLDCCKGYTPHGFAEKVFHLHIRRPGGWDEIVFCEYLKKHPGKAREYAALKSELQRRFQYNRDAYTEAKGGFIRACVAEAREQMEKDGLPA